MRAFKKAGMLLLLMGMILGCALLSGGCASLSDKRIVRIAHSQSETHPEHLGLLKFKEYIEENLGDKYEVQLYPNELLGGQTKVIELVQTGAIDFVLVGTPNLENFTDIYEVFSMPYLFTSEESYHAVMNDTEYMQQQVYRSTDEAGFRVLTWYNAGTRSFYAKTPIHTPDDLKGLKIRVQQSPASVNMCNAFGAAASPMSFGEVYTAIQQGVIDGAENNELALTNNKHGEVAKYYAYNKHQMVPDVLVGNLKFLEGLSDEEFEVFQDAALLSTEVELVEWEKQIEEARKTASEDMGVEFVEVDVQLFKDKVSDVQDEMLAENEAIRDLYDHIQKVNEQYTAGSTDADIATDSDTITNADSSANEDADIDSSASTDDADVDTNTDTAGKEEN